MKGLSMNLLSYATLLLLTGSAHAQTADISTEALAAQNAERALSSTKPLAWDPALAAAARVWADEISRSGSFEHDDLDEQGENLWKGAKGSTSVAAMIGAWIAEKKQFKSGIFPAVSKTGKWEDVGHYTQVVWPATTRVGCARSSGQGMDYLVCRYSPGGNMDGDTLNIQEKTKAPTAAPKTAKQPKKRR
jgi:uncharacterized protein YkwD